MQHKAAVDWGDECKSETPDACQVMFKAQKRMCGSPPCVWQLPMHQRLLPSANDLTAALMLCCRYLACQACQVCGLRSATPAARHVVQPLQCTSVQASEGYGGMHSLGATRTLPSYQEFSSATVAAPTCCSASPVVAATIQVTTCRACNCCC